MNRVVAALPRNIALRFMAALTDHFTGNIVFNVKDGIVLSAQFQENVRGDSDDVIQLQG